ncbi:hypothetical protein pb186bvf_002335 [Paramecium bursaria]
MSVRINLKSVGLSQPIELIIQNQAMNFRKILELLYEFYEFLRNEELIFSKDKTATQRISLETKIKDLKIVDQGTIYFFLRSYLENQKDQVSNKRTDKNNELSMYLEAVGFNWPRDDPKQISIVPRKDNNFEEILQFLQEEENIDQEIIFSQDKTGTQIISNLKTTLNDLKLANNGTIYVLLKQNVDKQPPQPKKWPFQKVQQNKKLKEQEPPQNQQNQQQNEFIFKGQHGLTIQEVQNLALYRQQITFLLESKKNNNWAQDATLKEEDGQEITSDPNYILQQPQIQRNGRYILQIGTITNQQNQRDSLNQQISQVSKSNFVQISENELKNQVQLENKDSPINLDQSDISQRLSQVIMSNQTDNQQLLESHSSFEFNTLTNIQIQNSVFQQLESSDQDNQYEDIQNEVNELKSEWRQQILELRYKLDQAIDKDQQDKLIKFQQIEQRKKIKSQENKQVIQLNDVQILSNNLWSLGQINKMRKESEEMKQQNEELQ